MNRMKGFTLVELLVVMAIISILAAIAVPNIIGRIERARGVRAIAEIRNIDLAITSILGDAGVSSLNHLFNPDGVREYIGIAPATMLAQPHFERAQQLYTRTLYALLREGRQALADRDTTLVYNVGQLAGTNVFYGAVLNKNVVNKLGTSYFVGLAQDPWGNLYQIFPGPWPSERLIGGVVTNQIPFRVYTVNTGSDLPGSFVGGHQDALTLIDVVDPETGAKENHGYAAPREKPAFIWSYGANFVSGQALYRQIGYVPPGQTDYYPPQDPELMGGGDDINNWDNEASWGRFYN